MAIRSFTLAAAVFVAVNLMAPPARAAEFKLDGRTFTLPDGFTIERVAGPGLVDRPIVASSDERGRLYVADSSGSSDNVQKQLAEKPHRIVRLEDADGDGRFDKTTVFADKMMFPEGCMWHDGSVYVSAPPSIWKLTDTDGDGVADQRKEWFQGKTLTGCANDLHGPYLGPDGWIYWAKGAFAEQKYTLPNGKPFVTKASHIFRARPDGTGVEPVMTGGMDNPVDVVFTPGGERIFSCTFLQNPAGGKRDGLIHAIYGGVYGKVHDVIENHPRTSPDVMPVLSHLGPAAACGLTRYESDAFGDAYRDNLFCTLFNMHKVTRHVLTPEGATFKSKDEDFLVCDSLDFHPTDVIEDADGSLLVIDTGGWYKLCCPTSQLNKPDVLGAIYRVRRSGAKPVADPRGLKLTWDNLSFEELSRLLDDPRPVVAKRAIETLARKGPAALAAVEKAIANSGSTRSRLNGIWTASRINDSGARAAVRSALKDSDETVRQAAAHAASVWRDREASAGLLELLNGKSAPNRRVVAEALGRLGDARAVPALLQAAGRDQSDRALDHSVIYALIEIGDHDATAKGLFHQSAAIRRAALIALDQMGDGPGKHLEGTHVAENIDSSDPALREAAVWVAGRHPDWDCGVGANLHGDLIAAAHSPDKLAGVLRLVARLGSTPEVQKKLAERLGAEDNDDERRVVLQAMAVTELKATPRAWVGALAGVLGGKSPALIPDAVAVLRKLPPAKDDAATLAKRLVDVAGRTDVPPAARVDALAAVQGDAVSLDPALFDFLKYQVAPDEPVSVRVTAASVLGKAKLTTEQLGALTDAIRTAGPMEIDRLLAAYEKSSDDVVGLKLVDALAHAKAVKSLRAEVVKARLAKFSPAVRKAAEPLLASLDPGAEAQRKQLEEMLKTLPSGDVRRGQVVFNGKQAACSTCHAIGYIGGHVGPDLTRVGSVRQERDLLESIVFPSASFVQSFEPVLVDTRGGDRQSGILKKNDADEVVLITGPEQETHIPRKDVEEMRPSPVSVMPAGLDQQLTKQDLADLVAFLKACK